MQGSLTCLGLNDREIQESGKWYLGGSLPLVSLRPHFLKSLTAGWGMGV